MKVIQTSSFDNFNADGFKETLFSFEKLTKKEAEDIAEELNRPLDLDYSPIYYAVVEDDYKLCPGFEP